MTALMATDPLAAIAWMDRTLASPHVTREQSPPLLWIRARCLMVLERYVEAVEVLLSIPLYAASKPFVLAEHREAALAVHLLGLSESDPWTLDQTLLVANKWLGLAEDQGKTLDDTQMGLAQGRLTVAMGLLVAGEPAAALEMCSALARDVSNDRAKRVVRGVMGFAHAESGDLEKGRRVLAGLRLDAPNSVWTRRLGETLDSDVTAPTRGETGGFGNLGGPSPSAMHVLTQPKFAQLAQDDPGAAVVLLGKALARVNLSEYARANLLAVRSSLLSNAGRFVEELADLHEVASIRPWRLDERHNFWDGVLSAHVLHQQHASESVLGDALAESCARLEQLENTESNAVDVAAVQHTVALGRLATGDPTRALELAADAARRLATNADQHVHTARLERSVAATIGLAHLAAGDVELAAQVSDQLTHEPPDDVWTRGLARAIAAAAAERPSRPDT